MADILIKGLELPENWEMESININRDGKVTRSLDLSCEQIAEAVIVPAHGPLIDASVLYNKTAEWEAQALHLVGTSDEWRKWSTILAERTAFKYDIADAPTVIEASEDSEQDV